MQSLDRILLSAKADAKLQSIIDDHLRKDGVSSTLVVGFTFKEEKGDYPAFSLGGQMLNFPIGVVCVSDGLLRTLTYEQLEFVVLHELGHILSNHWATNLIILLAKDFIVEQLAKAFGTSIEKAKENLGLIKACLSLFGVRAGRIEEEIKAKNELEADRYAVIHQGRKDPAISVLSLLTAGNVSTPTHVTVDGSFTFPIVTAEERIEAIRNLILLGDRRGQ